MKRNRTATIPDVHEAPDLQLSDWDFRQEFGSLQNGVEFLSSEAISHSNMEAWLRTQPIPEPITNDPMAKFFHERCVECEGTDRPHAGKGLCRRCYLRQYAKTKD